MREPILPLVNARGSWVEGEHADQWEITDETGKRLAFFPAHWNEKDVMCAIRFGRTYEQRAYAAGLVAAREQSHKQYDFLSNQLRQEIASLARMNEELSDHLEKLITD